MSGGNWEYLQRRLSEPIDDVQGMIDNNGKAYPEEELKYRYITKEHLTNWPEDGFHPEYPEEMLDKFKDAIKAIKKAYVYIQRLDWFLSGDDGRESFMERLEEELKQLEDEQIRTGDAN